MANFKNQFNSFIDFFLGSYKLSSTNKDSLEERSLVSFRGYQIAAYSLYLVFLIGLCVFLLVGYGPLSGLLPQTNLNKKRELIELIVRVDSLERNLLLKSQYVDVVGRILKGEVVDSFTPSLVSDSGFSINTSALQPSKADSLLREIVYKEDLYNISPFYKRTPSLLENLVFFKPAEGLVSDAFNVVEKHYGLDIVTHPGASIKSCLDGVVVFADWSVSSGNTILIQHPNNIMSVYMHAASLRKSSNDLVKAGEVIGIVGNSGETSSGPHLHFELWQNGVPINPVEYIDF